MPLREAWHKAGEWFVHLLHLDESAHRIALGVAIGIFISLTPTVGIQMLLIFFITSLFRASRVAGVPMAWITNPATLVPIYSFNYMIGRALVGGPPGHTGAKFEEALAAVANPDLTWWHMVKEWWDLMTRVALPLWVGSVVVGAIAALAGYGLMYYLIRTYRRIHQKHLAEAAARASDQLADEGPGFQPSQPKRLLRRSGLPRRRPGEPGNEA